MNNFDMLTKKLNLCLLSEGEEVELIEMETGLGCVLTTLLHVSITVLKIHWL